MYIYTHTQILGHIYTYKYIYRAFKIPTHINVYVHTCIRIHCIQLRYIKHTHTYQHILYKNTDVCILYAIDFNTHTHICTLAVVLYGIHTCTVNICMYVICYWIYYTAVKLHFTLSTFCMHAYIPI